jgi:YVTN family beta-propeller protein
MGLAVAPDGGRLYVATGRGGTVEVVDTRAGRIVGSVKVGARPWGIALTRDGRKLYVANGPSNDVSVVDTQRLRVTATIAVGALPWGIAIGPAAH